MGLNPKVRRVSPWAGQWTIAHRILALNLLTLVIFGLSILYLDAFRNQLQDERVERLMREAAMTARTRDPLTVLDNVYAEPHSGLAEQREWFGAYLDGFAPAAEGV